MHECDRVTGFEVIGEGCLKSIRGTGGKALLIRWDSDGATGKRDARTLATLPGVARKRKDEKKRGGKQGGGGGGEEGGGQWREEKREKQIKKRGS